MSRAPTSWTAHALVVSIAVNVGLVCLYYSQTINSLWNFQVKDVRAGVALGFSASHLLHQQSQWQSIDVYHNDFFGNILAIDNDLMLTTRDEASYHEMLVHVPLNYVPHAESVLIVGGGDGGACARVLEHPNVKHVTLVDIDAAVGNISLHYFAHTRQCYSDPRVVVVHEDAAAWAVRQSTRYDVILVDSTDFNRAETILTQAFYLSLKNLLSDIHGIVVLNLSSFSWNMEASEHGWRRQSNVFRYVVPYQVFQPTYMSGHYGYLFCSDYVHPLEAPIAWGAFVSKRIATWYYSPAVHWAAFALPQFVADKLTDVPVDKDAWAKLPSRYPLTPNPPAEAEQMGIGQHLIVELFGVDAPVLCNSTFLEKVLVDAAAAGHLTVVNHNFHTFSPHGVTGFVLLQESHISIHTWPEYGYAAVDVFACADNGRTVELVDGVPKKKGSPKLAVEYIRTMLQPASMTTRPLPRGVGLAP